MNQNRAIINLPVFTYLIDRTVLKDKFYDGVFFVNFNKLYFK